MLIIKFVYSAAFFSCQNTDINNVMLLLVLHYFRHITNDPNKTEHKTTPRGDEEKRRCKQTGIQRKTARNKKIKKC